ncbi:hypothetical protein ARNL5_00181 [Anaerolineae bacterium]|nr:hypothetical protein ARNL5_00181 [Anaerolineae bacterium]
MRTVTRVRDMVGLRDRLKRPGFTQIEPICPPFIERGDEVNHRKVTSQMASEKRLCF